MTQFHLQIHITGRCNCRCKHCYIAPNVRELSPEQMERILLQYDSLINRIQKERGEVFPYVYITGGEPFLHSQIEEIFALIRKYNYRFSFRFMTNGTVIRQELLEDFCTLNIPGLQVSIDGTKKTHDRIRGEGNLEKVIHGLDVMHAYGIQTRVSFTAHQGNYREFSQVAELCRAHHVSVLWSDRYVPCQENQLLSALTPAETKEYVELLEQEKRNPLNREASLTIKNVRSLQFLSSGEYPYCCTAGLNALAIDEAGEVYPCRRFASSCGNISDTNLEDIYYNNELLKELRLQKIPTACMSCRHRKLCRGGSRCNAYATYGDFNQADPGCWLSSENS